MTLFDAYAGHLLADYFRTRRAWAQCSGDERSVEFNRRRVEWDEAHRELAALCRKTGAIEVRGRAVSVAADGRLLVVPDEGGEPAWRPSSLSMSPSRRRSA